MPKNAVSRTKKSSKQASLSKTLSVLPPPAATSNADPQSQPSDLDLYKHQIASPLTTIICSLEQHLLEANLWEKPSAECKLLLDQIHQEKPDVYLRRALNSAQEISDTLEVRDHKATSSVTRLNCHPFCVAQIITQACQQFKKPYPVTLNLDLDSISDHQIFGNPQDFKLIITHLLNNAAEAYLSHKVDKKIDVWGHPHQGGLIIAISDCGQGIAAKNLTQVFQTNFSTKKDRGGLGLWEVKKILVEEFDAEIDIRSKINSGSTVCLFL